MRRLIPSLFIVLSFFPGLAHGVLVNVTLPAGLPPIAPMGDRGPLPIGETTQEIFFSASPDPDTDEFFVGGKVVAENKGGKVFTLSLTDFVFSHDQVGVLSVTVEMVQDYKMIEAVMLDGGSASHMFDGEATFVCCAVLQSSKVTMNSEHEGFGLDEISNFQTAIRPFPDLRRTAAGPTGRDDFIPIDPYTIISKVEVELDGSNVATSRTGPAEIQLIRLDLPSSADNVGVVRTIPVPATHLLLGLGLAATACTRRRRGC